MRLLDANTQTNAQINAVTPMLSGSGAALHPHRFDAGSEFNPGRFARLCGSSGNAVCHPCQGPMEGRPA